MRQIWIFSWFCFLFLNSCTPKITTNISKRYVPINYREDIRVLGIEDTIPVNSEEIGTVKIGDTGFSGNCSWDEVIDKAKMEARRIGGNAIKITNYIPPSALGSSCHRITATILKIDSIIYQTIEPPTDSNFINTGYAIVHIYRPNGLGILVNYDLYLEDTILCRISNNLEQTFRVTKEGLNTFWARTEVREELPVRIKFGNEYYIRCSIAKGSMVGRPRLELIDNKDGNIELQSVRLNSADKLDILFLKDGQKIKCAIIGEDKENVYFLIFKEGKQIQTLISKTQLKSIHRSE